MSLLHVFSESIVGILYDFSESTWCHPPPILGGDLEILGVKKMGGTLAKMKFWGGPIFKGGPKI